MADDNNTQDKEDEKKLKSLEKALAQELDQKVSFGASNDIRLSDDVDVNPILSIPLPNTLKKVDSKIIVAGAPTNIQAESSQLVASGTSNEEANIGVGGQFDEDDTVLSLEDLDKIFDETGPEFRTNLENIREEVKKVADGKSLEESTVVEDGDLSSLDTELVKGDPYTSWPPGLDLIKAILRNLHPQKIKKDIQDFKQDLPNKIQKIKKNFVPWLIKTLKFLWGKTLDALKIGLALIKSGMAWFFALEKRMKLMLGFIFLSFIALIFTIRISLKGGIVPSEKNLLVGDLNEKADEVFTIEEGSEWNSFQDPVYLPDFSVSLNRIVVNIKKSPTSSSNPMMLFEIIVATSNQDAAVEIKTRMPEVRDLVSRIAEEISYDDLVTVEGKEKLKLVVRRELNQTLATGRVQKILFKSLVVKP